MAARNADGGAGGDPGWIEGLWEDRPGPGRRALRALLAVPELVFRAVVAVRNAAYSGGVLRSRPAPVPAICVGNLTVGGSGKTPMVRWVVERLLERGSTPAVLHGGYAPDEPTLHRHWFPDLPVVADRDRVRGARAAAEAGADVLILDDGFQHRRLARTLDLVLVAAETWTPRPRLLPRGPYREPLRSLERADVVVVTRRTAPSGTAAAIAREVEDGWGRPTAVAFLGPGGWLAADGSPRAGAPEGGVIAVAGIGRPRAFFRQLEALGVEMDGRLTFRDHHAYTKADATAIRDRGRDRPVVTTAKDAVKLAPLLEDADLWVLDQTVRLEAGEAMLLALLEEASS